MDRRKSREEAASRAAPRGRGTRRFRRFDAARGAAPLGIRSRAGGSAKSLGIWRRRCSRGTRARGRAPKPSRRRASPPRGGSPPPTERPFETRKRRSRTPRAIIERVSRAKRRGRERRFHRGHGKTNAPPPRRRRRRVAPSEPRGDARTDPLGDVGRRRREQPLVVPRDVGGARRFNRRPRRRRALGRRRRALIRYARVARSPPARSGAPISATSSPSASTRRRRRREGASAEVGPTDTPASRRIGGAVVVRGAPGTAPPSSAPASLARVARGEASNRRLARAVMRAFEALGVDTSGRVASAHAARARGWAADAALRDACEKALAKGEDARSGPRERSKGTGTSGRSLGDTG